MIERQIIVGMITNTTFLQQIRNIYDPILIESTSAKRIAGWAWSYFEKYNKAIDKDIETLFFKQVKQLSKTDAEDIEEILSGLSDESIEDPINIQYLLDETQKYFKERRLSLLSDSIQALVAVGQLEDAEKMALDYMPIANDSEASLDLNSKITLDRVEKAFIETGQPVVTFPKQLGKFWNSQFVKGGLISILASDKKGKSFFLLDIAIRACRQKKKVVFFQAGDMTESSQLKRICVYLTQKSDQKRYCGKMWQPVRDCINNQLNECTREERECSFGIFEGKDKKYLRQEITFDELVEMYNDNKDYLPCCNCEEYETRPWGAVWIEEVDVGENALTVKEAQVAIDNFFIKHKRNFKLSSHANGTLSIKQIRALLAVWEKQEFIPDLIVIDYADLLIPEIKEFRHGQDEIWRGLRRLSQEKGQPLVVTATQADARAYEKNKLTVSNFSEDKRKNAHITASYALNQDSKGREKKIGIIRLGELLLREDDYDITREVTILQNLKRGRPFIASYW